MKKLKNSLYWILSVVILSMSFLTIHTGKQEPIEVKDDSRIQVHMNTRVLLDALEKHASNWGTYEVEWAPLNELEESSVFVIESTPEQKFYQLLHKNDAAVQIVRDYPYLFSWEEKEDGSCRFEMACDQGGDGYVVFPTWLLAELIEQKVLVMPK